MNDNTDLQVIDNQSGVLDLPSAAAVTEKLAQVAAFQKLIQGALNNGHDYGTIPGTNKPTLLKPGAEKITKLLGLADTYEVVHVIRDWDRPLFSYEMKCRLVSLATGQVVAEGLGQCSSYESKYRWRQGERICPECGREGAIIKGKAQYGGGWLCWKKKEGCGATFPDGAETIESQAVDRIENPDVFDQINTFLKMAKKRSLVDAALSVGRLSDLFTQDMDDQSREAAPDRAADATKQSSKPSAAVPQKTGTNGDTMTVTVFQQTAQSNGWSFEKVKQLLGGLSATEWLKEHHPDTHNYRLAWDECQAKAAEPVDKDQVEQPAFEDTL
jgi:hypothetical protein